MSRGLTSVKIIEALLSLNISAHWVFLESYILFQISQFLMGSGTHFLRPLGNPKMRGAWAAARIQGVQEHFCT